MTEIKRRPSFLKRIFLRKCPNERHTWADRRCVCTRCGATRDEGHIWYPNLEQCNRCGKRRTASLDEKLNFAIRERDTSTVASLLKANVKAPLDGLKTILTLANTDEDSLEIVNMLITGGADIEIPDPRNHGWTPLMHAAFSKCPKIVKLLIEKGANTAVKDEQGRTVFTLIRSKNDHSYYEVLRVLAESTDEGRSWLHSDSGKRWQKAHEVEHSAPLPVSPAEVTDALEAAFQNGGDGLQRIIQWIEKGGDLSWRTPNGWTLLHLAAKTANEKMVNYLLEHGADIEARGERNETPLVLACDYGYLSTKSHSMVALLLSKGANPNVVDRDGYTALRHVRRVRNPEAAQIAKILENAGGAEVDPLLGRIIR